MEYMTPKQAADYLVVSVRRLRKMTALPRSPMGKRFRYSKTALDAYMTANQIGGDEEPEYKGRGRSRTRGRPFDVAKYDVEMKEISRQNQAAKH
jgi:excisionase family DNA binding protein